ncbi:MAG: AAA family ATPase, partial [Proteobacteria bacterium]|nr:AAA family ATPase [Pseudomonadota bacterium]
MELRISSDFLEKTFKKQTGFFPWACEHLSLDTGKVLFARDLFVATAQQDKRLIATLLLLIDAVNNGSLCLDIEDVKFKQNIAAMGMENLDKYIKSLDLVSLQVQKKTPLVLQQNLLYFEKYHSQEQFLNGAFRAFVDSQRDDLFDAIQIKQVINTVISDMRQANGDVFVLDSKQIQAVICSLFNSFSIISGGPGTGKTTIITVILRCLHRLGVQVEQIALAAPTGRAAKRMKESLLHGLDPLK